MGNKVVVSQLQMFRFALTSRGLEPSCHLELDTYARGCVGNYKAKEGVITGTLAYTHTHNIPSSNILENVGRGSYLVYLKK